MNPKEQWRLSDLLTKAGISVQGSVRNILIHQVTDDSRQVQPGTLFVAVQGVRVDGHRFISQAIEKGAAALLVEEKCEAPTSVVTMRVQSTQSVLGPLVHTFLGSPSTKLKLVGVTGTNGKTTVAWLIWHLLESAHSPCGLIGTVCHRVGHDEKSSGNTTPGVVTLQGMLAEMVDQGIQNCAMEVSSHSLDQHRTAGLQWTAGIFTNLSSEHLDYHETLEKYLQAKLKLFQALSSESTAIINRDDPVWQQVCDVTKASVVTYSLRHKADFTADQIRGTLQKTDYRVTTPEGSFRICWSLIGLHNIENLLAALGAVQSVGIPITKVLPAIERFQGVPGRLERVEAGQHFPVFVDYAHTDGALTRILEQLRRVTNRKILLIFGCGGDRDRTKRPRMGRVATTLADRVFITSDNPRTEDPGLIAQEIVAGIQAGSSPWEVVLDRRHAIQKALEAADEKWVVLIAGKGHETGQIFRNEIIPFDDRHVVREFLGVCP